MLESSGSSSITGICEHRHKVGVVGKFGALGGMEAIRRLSPSPVFGGMVT